MSYLKSSNESLTIYLISACFNNTSATYKYYWMLVLIQGIEEGKQKIQRKKCLLKYFRCHGIQEIITILHLDNKTSFKMRLGR